MDYKRMPIEVESPEELGYETILYNLAESSVTDAVLDDIDIDLKQVILCYGSHRGKEQLRQLIVNEEPELSEASVLITPSAATALFIINTTLLDKEAHLIVIRPNYATNIETPRAIGCAIDFVDLTFDNGFQLDVTAVAAKIKPATRLISITHPHNPTGVVIEQQQLNELIALARKQQCYVLVDETYRDLNFTNKHALAATRDECVISVSSLSKAYGLPGIRIGWLVTRNKELYNRFLAAKEQILICNSVVDEEIAYQFLKRKDYFFPAIKERIHKNFSALKNWISSEKRMEWVEPKGGVVCFPRIIPAIDTAKFYDLLLNEYKTAVGPGHWFEMPDNYMRIGYGYADPVIFEQGLKNISLALDTCCPN
jgi:aspartate/methionine/tyrosine aminotransferase